MGCGESKERGGGRPRSNSVPSRQVSGATRRCHFCGRLFALADASAHTVVCEEREVTCHHSWCRAILKQKDLRAHMHECQQSRRSLCPKCGESFPATEMSAHRGVCDVVQCEHCPERVIPRMIKYCPNLVLGKLNHRTGPFASERLRERYVMGITSPSRASPAGMYPVPTSRSHSVAYSARQDPLTAPGGEVTTPPMALAPAALSCGGGGASPADGGFSGTVSTMPASSPILPPLLPRTSSLKFDASVKPNVNFQVARIQQTWRWAKARAALEDLLFRIVYKEIDTKKETFSIFKAHDHRILDEEHRARQKKLKSAAPVQAVAPTQGHYFPAHATDAITVDIVNRVIEDFSQKKPLPYHAVWRILTDANNILQAQPNIWRMAPPEGAKQVEGRWKSGGKVVVVGDLHGQLHDLLTILHENALPSDRNMYVFNGDFVDRGHSGVEVTILLFLLLIVFPKHVALNRGNHECEYMNEEYGFDIECQTKYDRNIFKLIQRCFCSLPLATVIGTKVFVVHGGLPRSGEVTYEEIDTIQRFRQIPMPELAQPEEDEIFQDLMWADPQEERGWKMSTRGVGSMFGPDVTNAFLKTNKLELVIRSHEEFNKGHEEHHAGKLLTVFSASNYDGPGSNLAATITLMGDSSEYSVQTWACTEEDFLDNPLNATSNGALTHTTGGGADVPSTPAMGLGGKTLSFNMTFTGTYNGLGLSLAQEKEKFGHFCASLLGNINLLAMRGKETGVSILQPIHNERRTRDEVTRMVREQIFERRHRLLAYFTKIDRTQRGSIWKMEWVETMTVVLNLDLPWFFLRPSLTHTEPITHRIRYVDFLARFKTGVTDLWMPSWRTAALAEIYYLLFGRRRHPVAKVLADRTDPIGYNEFSGLIRQVSENVADNELFHLYISLANEGKWNCFITGPSIIEALENAVADFEADDVFDEFHESFCGWDLNTMDQLSSIISRLGPSLLRKLFECGRDEPVRTFDEFEKGITRICRGAKRPLAIREAAVQAMWTHILKHCVDPDEGIEINEILLAFAVRDYTALQEKREQFNELTKKLLGEEGCRPLRRRYSTTFVGFGPSAVPEGSPASLGISQAGNNGGRLSISMASPKGVNTTRRNTGHDTPPPAGEPPFGMSAYAMRRANMTPTSSAGVGHGFAQRQPSLDGDLGNSLEDQHGGRSFVSHIDPNEEVDQQGSSKMQSPSGKSPASKAPPGTLPTK